MTEPQIEPGDHVFKPLHAENDRLRATLDGIAYANYREWEDGMNTADDFVRWAQSRARNALGDWPESPPHDAPCECMQAGPDYCPRHAA